MRHMHHLLLALSISLGEVLIIESDEGDVMSSDIEEHQFLNEDVSGELVRQIEHKLGE